jgi:hypothetical protein
MVPSHECVCESMFGALMLVARSPAVTRYYQIGKADWRLSIHDRSQRWCILLVDLCDLYLRFDISHWFLGKTWHVRHPRHSRSSPGNIWLPMHRNVSVDAMSLTASLLFNHTSSLAHQQQVQHNAPNFGFKTVGFSAARGHRARAHL